MVSRPDCGSDIEQVLDTVQTVYRAYDTNG